MGADIGIYIAHATKVEQGGESGGGGGRGGGGCLHSLRARGLGVRHGSELEVRCGRPWKFVFGSGLTNVFASSANATRRLAEVPREDTVTDET